jgi:hypothetical protein
MRKIHTLVLSLTVALPLAAEAAETGASIFVVGNPYASELLPYAKQQPFLLGDNDGRDVIFYLTTDRATGSTPPDDIFVANLSGCEPRSDVCCVGGGKGPTSWFLTSYGYIDSGQVCPMRPQGGSLKPQVNLPLDAGLALAGLGGLTSPIVLGSNSQGETQSLALSATTLSCPQSIVPCHDSQATADSLCRSTILYGKRWYYWTDCGTNFGWLRSNDKCDCL